MTMESFSIGLHLKNNSFGGELRELATTKDFWVVRAEGDHRMIRLVANPPMVSGA